jgi:hypothetical protein
MLKLGMQANHRSAVGTIMGTRPQVRLLSLAALCGMLLPLPAGAVLTQFSTLADFQNAAGQALAVDTFGAAATVFGANSSVNVAYSGGAVSVVDPALTPTAIDWGTGAYLQFGSAAAVTLTFAPTTAFGALFGSNQLFPYDISIAIDGGGFMNVPTNVTPTLAFYGWTSDVAFTSVTIAGGESSPVLDNLTLAVSPVSEPSTFGMMLAGIGLMAAAVRRRTG